MIKQSAKTYIAFLSPDNHSLREKMIERFNAIHLTLVHNNIPQTTRVLSVIKSRECSQSDVQYASAINARRL